MVFGADWNGPFAEIFNRSTHNKVQATVRSTADMLATALDPLLRYIASVIDIPVTDPIGNLEPEFEALSAAARSLCSSWLLAPEHHHPEPTLTTAGDIVSASRVLAAAAYLGDDIVRSSLDHAPHSLWFSCIRHLDHMIDTIMDFTDTTRFAPTSLTPDDVLELYNDRATQLRNYGARTAYTASGQPRSPLLPRRPRNIAIGPSMSLTGLTSGIRPRGTPIRAPPPEPVLDSMIT